LRRTAKCGSRATHKGYRSGDRRFSHRIKTLTRTETLIDIIDHLPEAHVPEGVRLYYTGLEVKLGPVFGPLASALAVLPGSIQPARCLTALSEGQLAGILGIHNQQGSFLEPSYGTMVRHYGQISGTFRTMLLMLLDHKVPPGDLYLDGIVVDPSLRGQGIGSALVAAFEHLARENGFTTVSLEVIDTNPRARNLYERLGYSQITTHTMGPFSRLFGFRTTHRLTKSIRPAGS
jgi:ribosomal protein S18 acetylase RimI-like enzyme